MTPEETANRLINAATKLQAEIEAARSVARKSFRKAEPSDLNTFRISSDGLIAVLVERMTKRIYSTSETDSYQISVTASFVRTHFLTLDLLAEGEAIEAAVLLRKQVECLSRLLELDETDPKKLAGKTPNVGVLLKQGSGWIYGTLSEIAHFSTAQPGSLLHISKVGDRIGPSYTPHFEEIAIEYVRISHFLACRFAMWLLQRQKRWYPKENFDEADELAMGVARQALALELITLPK